jgi:hypothetical protein
MTTLANASPAYPTASNDSGAGQDGTAIDATFITDIRDAIDSLTHSATNPTITPKNIIDEVKTARGNLASLNARLAGVIDSDGALVSQASLVSVTNAKLLIGNSNWVPPPIIWAAGTTAAPSGWTLATSTVAREVTTTKSMAMSIALTSAGTMKYILLDSGAVTNAKEYLRGRTISFGCFVNASVGSQARLYMDDGVTTQATSYHSGVAGWEWLSATFAVSASATKLELYMQLSSAGTAYFDVQPTVALVEYALSRPLLCPVTRGFILHQYSGASTAINTTFRTALSRPFLVTDVFVECTANATVTTLIVDVDHWDGSSWASMFATRPTVATSAASAAAQPDATDYRFRCFAGGGGATRTNTLLRSIIDQATTGGDAPAVHIRGIQFNPAIELFKAYDDIGT